MWHDLDDALSFTLEVSGFWLVLGVVVFLVSIAWANASGDGRQRAPLRQTLGMCSLLIPSAILFVAIPTLTNDMTTLFTVQVVTSGIQLLGTTLVAVLVGGHRTAAAFAGLGGMCITWAFIWAIAVGFGA